VSATGRTTRRALLLLGALLTIALTTTGTAQAAFTDKAPSLTATSSTVAVAAPGSVSTGGTKCISTYNAWNGSTTTTLQAKVSWKASTTPRGVSGYLVTAYSSNGAPSPVAWVAAPATSVSGSYDSYYATQNIRVTVTTVTDYGWTTESPLSGAIKC
jgi:hypothetical protein